MQTPTNTAQQQQQQTLQETRNYTDRRNKLLNA